ncbi:IPT/TIG domain protein [Burkholderia sp. MSHR3999]|uniref:IPT/TIG domain-containing protein n=1 Tax=Burkholderia sp. MSHR3999 TaxID=1542965 RepID=UPI0005B7484A|nr:IPT/TIG domain-containing protein [Burkholderia sp. MSHR3999]KIP19226.1 IPT/TIG domain protein [Burkholderia sp. MSHR3999]
MESLGKGEVVGGGDQDGSGERRHVQRSLDRWFRASLIRLLCLVLLAGGFVHAQSTRYVYDANGRVVAVTANNGASVQYGYDTLGQASQISAPLSSGQLAIFSFMPTHGAAGTQVILQGQGFSSTLANNRVSFNGTPATVVSATATQLVTSVPTGATTGPISVTVGTQTATSASAFVVDDGSLPPTISQVSPVVVAAGNTVTVAGTHLEPLPGQTTVALGATQSSLSTASDTQLQFAVPSNASSGPVVVQTPYGQAISSSTVLVVPNGITPANVVSTGVATIDSAPVSLAIGAAGQSGAVLFTASGNSWVSLQASGITTTASNLNYSIYAPGNLLIAKGSVSATTPSIHLPRLPSFGTYLAIFTPDTAGAQLTVGVQSNATVTMSGPTTVTTTTPSQSNRVVFNATAGQTLAFDILSTSTAPAGQTVSYTVYQPEGGIFTSGAASTTGLINLANLPVSGTYQVVMAPGTGVTGTVQVQMRPGEIGAITVGGAAVPYAAKAAGQNIYLSFAANSGANLELTFNNISIAGASYSRFDVSVYTASGLQVASYSCYGTNPGASCTQHLWSLAGGNYTVVATPTYGGTISFNALLTLDVTGPTVAEGGTANVSLNAGQVERLTFQANAGDNVALQSSGIATTPTGQGVTFLVYRPDAGPISSSSSPYTSFRVTGTQLLNLSNLPVSGTYTVIAAPDYGLPASGQLSVVAGATGTLTSGGASQSYAANAPGENIYLSFTATQGANLELTFNNLNVAGAPYNQFNVYVYAANGTQVAGFACYGTNPGASCTQHLWYLTAGTYTAVATPSYGGTISFGALLAPDVIGPSVATGGTSSLSLNAGQVERLSFNANAGDTVALQMSSITTTPAGQGVTFLVYRPDAGAITSNTTVYASFHMSGTQVLNLSNLPVSGVYTVIAAPDYGLPVSGQFSVVAGAAGTMTSGGASQTYAANAAGENIYLSFTATQGANLELTLNNINITGATSNQFYVYVYTANGTQVAGFSCYGTNPGASCTQQLWYLTAGTYTVMVNPNYGGTIRFSALLEPDVMGPTVTTGGAASLNLSAGQVERLSFNASAGDTVALQSSGTATTPAGQGVTFLVYRPDVGAITSNTTAYTSFHATGTQSWNVSNLPISGTYTVIAAPDYGLPASAQFSVVSDTVGLPPTYGTATLPSNGVAQNEGTTTAGKNVTLTFNADAGDNLELTLSNVSVAGSGNNYVTVNAYSPTGAAVIATTYCYVTTTSSCRVPLWNLVAGTYSVVVAPPDNSSTISFNAVLQPDVIGSALAANSPTTVTLGSGQVERLTFNANAGDTVALQLSGVSTTPTGQAVYVNVYRPDTGAIVTTNYYTYLNTTTSTILNLPNLPATGAYTLVMYTIAGVPASAQITELVGVTGTMPADGTTQTYSVPAKGQNAYLTFNAHTGDNLELTLSHVSVTGSGSNYVTVNAYSPTGAAVVATTYCYINTASSCRLPLWNLAAGTYSVVIAPPDSSSTMSFNTLLQPDVIGSALVANTPTTVTLGTGQVERLSFNANAGDTVALQLSGVSTTPAGQAVYVNVYRPDTGAILTNNYYTYLNATTSAIVNLPNLPATGAYTLVMYTIAGVPANAQITALTGVTGTVPTNGTAQSYSVPAAGQNAYLTFNAHAGDNLELTLSNVSVNGASSNGNYVTVYAYDPTGVAVLGNTTCFVGTAAGCRAALWNLKAGTYSIVVVPPDTNSAMSFNVMLQPDVIGPALALNTPANVTLGTGQVERLTFNASAGDTVALQLSGVSTTPTGQAVGVAIYTPASQIVPSTSYTSLSTTTSTVLNVSNLPLTGTYTVVVYTGSGAPASAQVTLVPAASGNVSTTGSPGNFAASVAGQNVAFNFNANPGDNLELSLNNVSAVGASTNGFEVMVYGPNGSYVTSFACYAASPGSSCSQPLWNLAGGGYTAIAIPTWGGTISFTAQIQPDLTGPALVANTPATVTLGAGQAERLTFNATVGANLTLQLSNVSTTPSGQAMSVRVYRPDVGTITPANDYAQFSATGSNALSLTNLPVTGSYTVVVSISNGLPGSGQLTLVQ